MKINIEKNIVDFSPENAEERKELEVLWRLLIDCADQSRKMVPIGEYVPSKNDKGASFHIEGLASEKHGYEAILVESDCTCYCATCNNFVAHKKGAPVPLCCGKLMEIVD